MIRRILAPTSSFATAMQLDRRLRWYRLGSGIVLFAYTALHLACHALGLVSLASAEAALKATLLLWHGLPGSLLLYGAAAIHFALALYVVVDRPSLRMPASHVLRMALGFGIPLLLIGHVVSTRAAWELHAAAPTYSRVVSGLFAAGGQGKQLALLVPGWLHGCMGLYFAAGARPALRRVRPLLAGLAVVLPVLAALGFFAMGREAAALAADPGWAAANAPRLAPAQQAGLAGLRQTLLDGYFALIAATVLARIVRARLRRGDVA